MDSATHPPLIAGSAHVSSPAPDHRIPWFLWVSAIAVISSTIGGQWDLAWHRSIGRDSFWTPAHMAVYACGVLAAIVCLWLTASCTLGRGNPVPSIRMMGLRAPLGIFFIGWGGIAMLTSAAFDNWWHNAYGVDIQIISAPHILLLIGMRMVALGTLILILSAKNRDTANSLTLERLYLFLAGVSLCDQMLYLEGYTIDTMLHRAMAYVAICVGLPVFFAVIAETSRIRWPATIAAAIYMVFLIAEILLFPLFPAHPRIGPIYTEVTHLMPGKFPILLVAPALAFDLLWQRASLWRPVTKALVLGCVFTTVLVAVEWPFAIFLMSKASENRLFGTMYFGFSSRPDRANEMRQFIGPESGLPLAIRLAAAALFAGLSTFVGIYLGRWMRRVRR